jgi:hypothetical protein
MPKNLEFRYVFQSAAVKENTVNVFGEFGTAFEKGTDYDELITLYVPKDQLSNLIMYYNGITPDGMVGAQDPSSLRSNNAPVDISTIPTWRMRDIDATLPQTNENGYYYLGDIVMFAKDGAGDTKSCWTCVKTTSAPTDPILANGSFNPAEGTYKWPKLSTLTPDQQTRAVPGGYYGFNRISQTYIANVPPQTIDTKPVDKGGFKTINHYDYWQESKIASAYVASGNYYTGDLVIYNDTVYKVIDTNGSKTTPPLFLKGPQSQGIEYPAASLVDAPNGAYGYDWQGTRFIEGIPPNGHIFSSDFWIITTLPRVPTSTYTFLNWDNVKVHNKVKFYDDNIIGFKNNQTINTFADDSATDIYTLSSLYNANSKGFSLAAADRILASIPAAAIKSQLAANGLAVDFTLDQMIHSGPVKTSPFNYTPAIQGIFEDALAQDMMRSGGPLTSINKIRITNQSMGFTRMPDVLISDTLSTNTVQGMPTAAKAIGKLGIGKMFPQVGKAGTGYSVGDKFDLNSNLRNPRLDTPASVYVYGINADGGILSVTIVDPGNGYQGIPELPTDAVTGEDLPSYIAKTADGSISGGTGAEFTVLMTLTNVDFTLKSGSTNITPENVLKVTKTDGAGTGGYALVSLKPGAIEAPDGEYDVLFASITDPNVNDETRVNEANNGIGYARGDVIQLTQMADRAADTLNDNIKRLAVVDSVNGQGMILTASLLFGGFGYVSAPSVSISPPTQDPTASAVIKQSVIDENTNDAFYCFTVEDGDFTTTGRYPSPPIAKGPIADIYPYMGLGQVSILRAGENFAVGDVLTISEAGLSDANLTYITNGGMSGNVKQFLIYDGGSGYSKDQRLFLDSLDDSIKRNDPIFIDEVGGQIRSINVRSATQPFGQKFSIGDNVTIDARTGLRGTVSAVGGIGQVVPNISISLNNLTAPTGDNTSVSPNVPINYAVGDVVQLVAAFPVLTAVSIQDGGSGYTSVPDLVAVWSQGTTPAPSDFIPPVVRAILGVSSIRIVNGGTGYSKGDTIVFSGGGGVGLIPAIAEVTLVNQDSGTILAISILYSGSGYTAVPQLTVSSTEGSNCTLEANLTVVNVAIQTGGNNTAPVQGNGNVNSSSINIAYNGAGGAGGGSGLITTTTSGVIGDGAQLVVKKAFDSTTDLTGASITEYLEISFLGQLYQPQNVVKLIHVNIENPNITDGFATVRILDTFFGNITSINITRGYMGYGYVSATQFTSEAYVVEDETAGYGVTERITVPGYEAAANDDPNKYPKCIPIAVGDPTAISKVSFETVNTFTDQTEYTHKRAGTVEVSSVDSGGGITGVTVTSGYGYTSVPQITIPDSAPGSGAVLVVNALAVTRAEVFGSGTGMNANKIGTILKINTSVEYANPAAFAAMNGDLFPADLNLARNPNILQQLEAVKPGSTTGLASAVPIMGVSAVSVLLKGQGYESVATSNGTTYRTAVLEFSPPDLSTGRRPVATLNLNPRTKGINSITITDTGDGYLKVPTARIVYYFIQAGKPPAKAVDQTGGGSGFAIDTIYMTVTGARMLSGGAGYSDGDPPAIRLTPDSNGYAPSAFPRMKRAMLGINIEDSGAYYTTIPNARVQGDGGGVPPPNATMCVSDVRIVEGASSTISKYDRVVIDCYVPDVEVLNFGYKSFNATNNTYAETRTRFTEVDVFRLFETYKKSRGSFNYINKLSLADLLPVGNEILTNTAQNNALEILWYDGNKIAATSIFETSELGSINSYAEFSTFYYATPKYRNIRAASLQTTDIVVRLTRKHKTTSSTETWLIPTDDEGALMFPTTELMNVSGSDDSGTSTAGTIDLQYAEFNNSTDEWKLVYYPVFSSRSKGPLSKMSVPNDDYLLMVASSPDHEEDIQTPAIQPDIPHVHINGVGSTTNASGVKSYTVTSLAFGVLNITAGTELLPASVSVGRTDLVACGGSRYNRNPKVLGVLTPNGNAIPAPLPTFSTRLGIISMDRSDRTNNGRFFKSDPAVIIEPPLDTQQARYAAALTNFRLTSMVPLAYGSGYTVVPKVTVNGGGGSGATANAIMGITAINVLKGGSGYKIGDTVTFTLTGSDANTGRLITRPVAFVESIDGGGSTLGSGCALDVQTKNHSTITNTNQFATPQTADPFVITTNGAAVTIQGGKFNSDYGYNSSDHTLDYRDATQIDPNHMNVTMTAAAANDAGAGVYNYRVGDSVTFKERSFLIKPLYDTLMANVFNPLKTAFNLNSVGGNLTSVSLIKSKVTISNTTTPTADPAYAFVSNTEKAPFFQLGDYFLIKASGEAAYAVLRLNANARCYDYDSFAAPNDKTYRLPPYNEYQKTLGASYISPTSPENELYSTDGIACDTIFSVETSHGNWTGVTALESIKLIIQTTDLVTTSDSSVIHRVSGPELLIRSVYFGGIESITTGSVGVPTSFILPINAGTAMRYLKFSDASQTSSKEQFKRLMEINAAKDEFGRRFPNMVVDTNRMPYIPFQSSSRGEISVVTLTELGRGFTSVPTCTVTSGQRGAVQDAGQVTQLLQVAGTGAEITASMGVVDMQMVTTGNNYASTPSVYVDMPLHISAPPEYLANSAAIREFKVIGNGGTGYRVTANLAADKTITINGRFTPPSTALSNVVFDKNSYTLNPIVDGTLHGLNFPDAVTATVQIRTDSNGTVTHVYLVNGGSNYRIGDQLQIIDNTRNGRGKGALIEVTGVTDSIAAFPANGSYLGFDYFKAKNYGTGYTSKPKAKVVGGAQGIVLAPTLSLSNVDLFNRSSGGSGYTEGDIVYASSPELRGTVAVGKVSKIRSSTSVGGTTVNGIIQQVLMFTPYVKCMNPPEISVTRKTPLENAIEAKLVPCLGVDNVQITLSPDGFVGGSLIVIDGPTGTSNGYITSRSSQLSAKIFKDINAITISQPTSATRTYYVDPPVIVIDAPSGYDPTSFVGWYAMYFEKGDALDTIVQYSIGKALSFQVDPDASLPGKYFTAESITIGGVTIPLRAAGSTGAQGREMSANKIIHRYLVRYLAI